MNSNHPLYKVVREMARADDDQVGVSRIAHMLEAAERAGYVLVPLEATEAMIAAFYAGEWMEQKPRPSEIWDDMIAARPLPSPPEPSP